MSTLQRTKNASGEKVILSNSIVGDVLTLENYEDWKIWMQNYLVGQGLWDIVKGKEKKPLKDDASWRDKNGRAIHAIQISCGSDMFNLIKELTLAEEAWNTLEYEWKWSWGVRRSIMNESLSRWQKMKQGEEGCEELSQYRILYDAAFNDDWKTAKKFFEENPEAVTARIDKWLNTALHIAAQLGNTHFVEEMVKIMTADQLETRNGNESTALHYVTEGGTKRMAEVMLMKNNRLLRKRDGNWMTPLRSAAFYNNQEVLLYLYSQTTAEELSDPFDSALLLRHLITTDQFDLATDLVRCCREAAIVERSGETALHVLARRPSAFKSGIQRGFWRRQLHSWFHADEQVELARHIRSKEDFNDTFKHQAEGRKEDQRVINIYQAERRIEEQRLISTVHAKMFSVFHQMAFLTEVLHYIKRRLWDVLQQRVPGIKQVRMTKLKNIQANELLNLLFDNVLLKRNDYLVEELLGPPLLIAAEFGISEFLTIALEKYPRLIEYTNANIRPVLHISVIYRQENIFNILNQGGRQTTVRTVDRDINQNNILHLAGKIAPSHKLNAVSGAALQMQRELQWYKAVEKIAPPTYKEWKNSQGMTPPVLFTEEHRELVSEGENWMKEMATSCSVVSALIITIMFAAAFTLPGGISSDTGTPLFLHTGTFILFVISDALALFSASTSTLIFLSILTSRYAENDFLLSSPTKLIIGLAMLFISIAGMMLAFSTTIFIILSNHLFTISVILVLLAGVPVTLFVFLQFPLFIDIVLSTYGSGIVHQ